MKDVQIVPLQRGDRDVAGPTGAGQTSDATGDLRLSAYDHYIQRALRHKDTMKRRRVTRGGEDPDGAHYTKTGYPRSTGAKDNDYNIGMALRSLGETKVNEAKEITRRPPSDTVKGVTHRVA